VLIALAGEARGQEVEEVIVSAQKVETRLIDTPVSVSVLDENAIESARITQFSDLVMLVPGLELRETFGRSNANVSIRGIAPGRTGDPTVLIFTDGFLGTVTNVTLFDLKRVEVVKGPQATLYGRNALGGVINYVTNEPGNQFEARARASYASFNTWDANLMLSGPIVADKLSARITATKYHTGGFMDNAFDGARNVDNRESEGVRLVLKATPTESFTSILRAAYETDDDACGFCAAASPTFNLADPRALGRGEVNVNQYNRFVDQDFLGGLDRDRTTLIWTNEFAFGSMKLSSISGYSETDSDGQEDQNRAPGLFANSILGFQNSSQTDTFSQELRLASDDSERLRWQLGMFYYHSDMAQRIDFLFPGGGTSPATSSEQGIENYAGFVDLTYGLTDKLTLGVGLRYDVEERDQTNLLVGGLQELEAKEWLPKLTLTYSIDDDTTVYTSFARAYKSGGFNSLIFVPTSYEPEYLNNVELGIKGYLADRRASYELATFYSDWTRQQISISTATSTGVINAGESTVYGVDGVLSVRATEHWSTVFSLAYINAEFDRFLDRSANPTFFGFDGNYAGNQIPGSPKITGSLGVQYDRPLDALAGWDLQSRLDYRYSGTRNLEPSGALEQDPYSLVNFSVGLAGRNLSATLFIDNALDERYHVGGDIGAGVRPLLQTGQPRTYGVMFDWKY
jgi:iron complex outermembrane receptor protein